MACGVLTIGTPRKSHLINTDYTHLLYTKYCASSRHIVVKETDEFLALKELIYSTRVEIGDRPKHVKEMNTGVHSESNEWVRR